MLAIGGPAVSGIYAILMRLADLTALPVRSFNTLLVQRIMRTPGDDRTAGPFAYHDRVCRGCRHRLSPSPQWPFIFAIFPNGLGHNVSAAAPDLMAMILLVPSFRNLVEYHSELLYATGRTVRRMANLLVAGVVKVGLLAMRC